MYLSLTIPSNYKFHYKWRCPMLQWIIVLRWACSYHIFICKCSIVWLGALICSNTTSICDHQYNRKLTQRPYWLINVSVVMSGHGISRYHVIHRTFWKYGLTNLKLYRKWSKPRMYADFRFDGTPLQNATLCVISLGYYWLIGYPWLPVKFGGRCGKWFHLALYRGHSCSSMLD